MTAILVATYISGVYKSVFGSIKADVPEKHINSNT